MQFVGEKHVAELGLSVGLEDRKRLGAQWEFVEIEVFGLPMRFARDHDDAARASVSPCAK